MLDPDLIEAAYRGLRAIALVTGILVAIDSVGVLLCARENPPHKPKWNAAAWLIGSGSAATITGSLILGGYPANNMVAPIFLYSGLSVSFTIRAISRAERPWLTVISASCMSCLAVWMAWQDVAG